MDQFSLGTDNERAELFAKSVRERDLDHFLIEELQASDQFREWFIGHLSSDCFSPPQDTRVRTERSPARLTDGRQTDLRLAYYDQDSKLAGAILIESKVADGFRLNQAEDYSREVTAWRDQLGKQRAACILVGPRNNQRISKGDHFDAFVAIDDMADVLKARRDGMAEDGELSKRLAIRIDLLEALAGKRAGSQWNPQPVPEKVALAEVYDHLVQERLPGYSVKTTVAGRRSGARYFGTFPGVDRFQGNVLLKHRIFKGAVILEFRHCPLGKDAVDRIGLPQDGSIELRWTGRAKNTLQLQVRTPPLRQLADASQRSDIETGLDAVKKIADWFSDNVSVLNPILGSALNGADGLPR
jgi:hypothetical protein